MTDQTDLNKTIKTTLAAAFADWLTTDPGIIVNWSDLTDYVAPHIERAISNHTDLRPAGACTAVLDITVLPGASVSRSCMYLHDHTGAHRADTTDGVTWMHGADGHRNLTALCSAISIYPNHPCILPLHHTGDHTDADGDQWDAS